MVTDSQARLLMKHFKKNKRIGIAGAKAGMSPKTASKYLSAGNLPSQLKRPVPGRPRKDIFGEVWDEAKELLKMNPGLLAKYLFGYLQREFPGRFPDGQLRTFQRRVHEWKSTEGPGKEVFFPQEHHPGDLSASDFTHMNSLEITINRVPFPHLIFHFVLTYSNWETGNVCFTESFESMSEGLQRALWELGGVTRRHRQDQMSAAVQKLSGKAEFTRRYSGLLSHYRMKGEWIQAGAANENGDVEQSHYRFKQAADQALMIRGSRNFTSRKEYNSFLNDLFKQLNANRAAKLQEELEVLRELPARRLEDCKRITVRVGKTSTIRVVKNTYSVPSRLIGDEVEVKIYAEELVVYYRSREIARMPRIRGEGRYQVNYRHIIESLVAKPGAFENLRYRDSLFPTTRFRMAYDWFLKHTPGRASRNYLEILYLAARESEVGVDDALRITLESENRIERSVIVRLMNQSGESESATNVHVDDVDISLYDELLCEEMTV